MPLSGSLTYSLLVFENKNNKRGSNDPDRIDVVICARRSGRGIERQLVRQTGQKRVRSENSRRAIQEDLE